MLVEINLLPEREPRKFAFVVILSVMITAMVLIGVFYFLQIHLTKNEISSVDRQITMTRKIANKQNNSVEPVVASNSVTQIKNAVKWANTYPIQTIPVMDHLTSLLPGRGFIQSFNYTEGGTISISVQFDSAREAAYFLNSLNNSQWFEEATLNSLSTTEASGQTAQAVSPANTDGSSNVATQSEDSKQTKSSNVLPRYTGQFDIKLNKETISKIIHKGEGNTEGGTGS